MNDFSDIEAELKKLRPHPVTPELATRIGSALAQNLSVTPAAGVTKKRRLSWNWLPLGLGLAAAATFLLLARISSDRVPQSPRTVASASPSARTTQPTSTTSSAPSFVPSGLTQVVYNTRDEGLQFDRGNDTPVRRVRTRKRETLQWHDPRTGASLRVSYPTEEVTLTPVSGQ